MGLFEHSQLYGNGNGMSLNKIIKAKKLYRNDYYHLSHTPHVLCLTEPKRPGIQRPKSGGKFLSLYSQISLP